MNGMNTDSVMQRTIIIGDMDKTRSDMEICKTDFNTIIRYLSDASKMYRLSEKARHQDRARQIRNLVLKMKKKT